MVSKIKEAIPKDTPLTGFGINMLKRQVYHAMFIDDVADDQWATIAYNDNEHMDKYNTISKAYTDYFNSGLATTGNLSFKEFMELPNWFADWLIDDWSRFISDRENKILEEQLNKDLQESKENVKKGREKPKPNDPWSNNY